MTVTVGVPSMETVKENEVAVTDGTWYAIGMPEGLSMSPSGVVSGIATGKASGEGEITSPVEVKVYKTTDGDSGITITPYTLEITVSEPTGGISITVTVDNVEKDESTSYSVQQNESIYRLPGERQIKCSAPGGRTVVYWAAIDGENAADFLLSYGYPRGPLKSGTCPVHLFEEIQHSLDTLLPSDLRRLVALYTELIGMMGEEHDPLSRKGVLFRDCLSLIQNRYQDPELNVNTLAEELKVHRTTLDRLFLREIGIPPNRYLLKIRLHHALSLLCCTKDPIAEIASKTGFSRSNYFDRVFREAMGFSPMEYRRRKREGI